MSDLFNKLMLWLSYHKTKLKLLVFYFPLMSIIVLLSLKIGWNSFYNKLIKEDSYFEYSQFIIYGCASFFTMFSNLRSLKKGLSIIGFILLILSTLFIFIALEEISWGQRIFKLNTPEWFQKHNEQNEVNIHNLKIIQVRLSVLLILFTFFFSFGWIPVKKILSIIKLRIDIKKGILLFSPRWYLMLYFLPTMLFYSYFVLKYNIDKLIKWSWLESIARNDFMIWRDQESTEILLALGFFCYVIAIINQQQNIEQNNFAKN